MRFLIISVLAVPAFVLSGCRRGGKRKNASTPSTGGAVAMPVVDPGSLAPSSAGRGANSGPESDVNAIDDQGMTGLMNAVITGRLKSVEEALKRNPDLNMMDSDGLTPLMRAIMNKRLNISRLLIENGADLNTPGPNGMTPLMLAASNDDIYSNSIVNWLLKYGAAVNKADAQGRTALMMAAAGGNYTTFCRLVEGGALSELKDFRGNTALDLLPKKSQPEKFILCVEMQKRRRDRVTAQGGEEDIETLGN